MVPLAAVVAIPALALLLGGCAPGSAPTPAPTPAFASEAEAFAAAEEVYRAYNEAGNDRSDDERYLTGDALSNDIESKRLLIENGLRIEGRSDVVAFRGTEADVARAVATITAEVCIDVSSSRVHNSNNEDVTPEDRADRWLVEVTFVGAGNELLIAKSSPVDGPTC